MAPTRKTKKLPGRAPSDLAPLSEKEKHLLAIRDAELVREAMAKEPWQEWNVKPSLKPMLATPHEAGIGKRIAYCRGQLDNLPIEALARYTKRFESGGISRQSLVRYESGDTMPGARELRILCDALWVPANWLLLGKVDSMTEGSAVMNMVHSLRHFIRNEVGSIGIDDLLEVFEQKEIAKRQKWLDEDRKPQSRI